MGFEPLIKLMLCDGLSKCWEGLNARLSDALGDPQEPQWPRSLVNLEVLAAFAARTAYKNEEEARDAVRARPTRAFKAHACENAAGLSWIDEGLGVLVLAFRGTEVDDVADVMDDADVRHVPLYWAASTPVHAGFERHFSKLEASVSAAVVGAALEGVTRVLFTGHSLGGAVALLAAHHSQQVAKAAGARRLQVHLRTFGAPRVGTRAFTDWCAQCSVAVVAVCYENVHDLVPDVPVEMEANFCTRRVRFGSGEACRPKKAHSMDGYGNDVLLLEGCPGEAAAESLRQSVGLRSAGGRL